MGENNPVILFVEDHKEEKSLDKMILRKRVRNRVWGSTAVSSLLFRGFFFKINILYGK